ncbi:hypothetical protein [Rhodococcus tibetensis]|uniref:Lipoprotein n=1 Tax=Rhodococcus tibetensis TaxID=2965064 RepID=A0ABT1QGB7_9NOCA|nr:hypothetical protein [Rhodococcus sp. FXJ9.536]MCQ4120718.1 hypothetical protein [Rhodococcus sp. FXJ9.536]
MSLSVRTVLLLATALLMTGCAGSVSGSADTAAAPSTTFSLTPPSWTNSATPSASTRSTTPSSPSVLPTAATSAPARTREADPQQYAGTTAGSFYFTTPSTKFHCAILTGGDLPTAGCHGPMPESAPKVPGSGAPDVRVPPNAIEVTGSRSGQFVSAGDPRYYPLGGSPATTLPYGRSLHVNDLSCLVEESTGVTCTSDAGHGFTLSDTKFRVW